MRETQQAEQRADGFTEGYAAGKEDLAKRIDKQIGELLTAVTVSDVVLIAKIRRIVRDEASR